jgi:chromosome segregation ATPase
MTKIDILDRAFQWTKDDEVAAWIKEAMAEIRHIRFCHGNVSKMLTEAAQIMDDQNKEIAKLKVEIEKLRDRQGHLDKMLSEAAQIIDDQNKEIAELKVEIDFERNMHQAEVNQLNDDIKFLRSKLPNL